MQSLATAQLDSGCSAKTAVDNAESSGMVVSNKTLFIKSGGPYLQAIPVQKAGWLREWEGGGGGGRSPMYRDAYAVQGAGKGDTCSYIFWENIVTGKDS